MTSTGFAKGDLVLHNNNKRIYRIECRAFLERNTDLVYVYTDIDGCTWVRPASEMEDGRFTRLFTNATLEALVNTGPLEDGDLPSKRERDDLVAAGLAVRIINKGQSGWNAATNLGSQVVKNIGGHDK